VRLLLDEMIGPRVAVALREEQWDVVALVERTDLRALADELVLEHASAEGRLLVTRNVSDFARLDQRWRSEDRSHAGIVMVTESAFPQSRNLIGALVSALLHWSEVLPRDGGIHFLRPA
jgi:predicted nuclease of predicted toxin-antitoxin system